MESNEVQSSSPGGLFLLDLFVNSTNYQNETSLKISNNMKVNALIIYSVFLDVLSREHEFVLTLDERCFAKHSRLVWE